MVCKYLSDHPENRQKDAEGLVMAALGDTWPCKLPIAEKRIAEGKPLCA
ncbi:hypothetical protein GR208_03830 [Rhizobium leguminosarum]|nr:hypothetical protein [Rhizobium ruizarguesonis]